jgi:hypothetical protein
MKGRIDAMPLSPVAPWNHTRKNGIAPVPLEGLVRYPSHLLECRAAYGQFKRVTRAAIEDKLFEGYANPFLASPYDPAWMLIIIAPNYQDKIIWDAKWAGDFKTSSGSR